MPWIKNEPDGSQTVRAQDDTIVMRRFRLHEKLVVDTHSDEKRILVHWSDWEKEFSHPTAEI